MNITEKAKIQHYHRRRLGHEKSYEQGYRSHDSQVQRFQALCQWGDFSGLSILDLGCGYGDLKYFLDKHFDNYVYLGVDFLEEFIHKANTCFHYSADTHFIQADFYSAVLPKMDIVIASGSLNYRREDPQHPWDIIDKMWHTARKGVVFNLLDKNQFGDGNFLCAYTPSEILDFCKRLCTNSEIIQGYLPDDFTIIMRR